MNIHHLLNKINSKNGPETISFDENGEVYPDGVVIDRYLFLRKIFLAVVIILSAMLIFGLGRLSVAGNREPIKIEFDPTLAGLEGGPINNSKPNTQTANAIEAIKQGSIVGSSKGNKYHYSYCPGAKQISEANKITFSSPEEAEKSGYTLAGNCKPK